MKKNSFKITFLVLLILLLCGCTKYLKTEDKKPVRNDATTICEACKDSCSSISKEMEGLTEKDEGYEELNEKLLTCNKKCEDKCKKAEETATGQNLTENILCQPTNEDVKSIYTKYGVDLSKIPTCNKFSVFNNYEGLWISVFVKSLAWILIHVGMIVNNYGLSLVLVSFLIRLCLMPITKKTAMQSENMKKAQPEIDRLNKKYENKTNRESQAQKAQETMLLYKKYDMNPLSSCLFAFLQIPILFAFIEAINRTPAIFEGTFLGLRLGITPWQAIRTGKWWYLILIAILAVVTYFSLNMNKGAAAPGDDTAKQMSMMNKFMLVFIVYASFSLSTAICLYWVTSSGFTVIQNILVKKKVK